MKKAFEEAAWTEDVPCWYMPEIAFKTDFVDPLPLHALRGRLSPPKQKTGNKVLITEVAL